MTGRFDKVLLVEGKQELRLIPELMEANGVDWGTRQQPTVYIREYDGYEKLIAPDVITTELQASGLKRLGVIVDADERPESRWQSLRNASLQAMPDLPESLPSQGLIHHSQQGIKFGIWIMPDNQMQGMLETFLADIIPEDKQDLWQFAQQVTAEAKSHQAPFKDSQRDKANIYSWLAWQNPPGRQLHQAITERILDPRHPKSKPFVTWFKCLYDL
ncbi:MAG: hypothetical protein EA395_08555 [Phormidium sp. GEM2.Bin31]|nr:MAG: hypothetical protein EA395_08555 [Phormidium sp. GEM2.Bin31]